MNSAAQYVYRIPTTAGAPATAYLVFLANPNVGDTITIGEDIYTFSASANPPHPAYSVNQQKPAATPPNTALNLLNAVTGDNGTYTNEGITYSKNTVLNPAVAQFNELSTGQNNLIGTADIQGVPYTYIQVFSPDLGAAYNYTNVSATGGNVVWLTDLNKLTDLATTFTGGANASFSNDISAPSTWLEFTDPYTNVVKSQVVNDKFQRYYFASPSQPPQYNTLARIQAGNASANAPFLLGINPPGCAPTVTVSNGGNSATLGPTSSNGNVSSMDANNIYLFPIVPNAALAIDDIQFMPNVTNTTVRFAAVVYSDTNVGGNVPTAPSELLNTGTIETGVTGGTLAVSQFVNPTDLIANTPYWVGIMLDTSINVQRADNQHSSVKFINTFTNGPPGIAPTATTGVADFYMYADLTSTDIIEARAYVYTWVSAYGEESAPSPYTLVNGWSNGTWTIGLFDPPSTDLGTTRNLAILRLYRTVTGTGGSTVYFWVADISLGSSNADAIAAVAEDVNNGVACSPPSATYVDIIPDTTVALNTVMPSTNYFPPPENLQGIIVMPNGMYAGWVDNMLWFCQPYYPHAWPPGTTITVDFPIVGLGFTQGSLVACTAANSWVATGTNPTQMSLVKCMPPDPCTSRGSIMSSDTGVYYISPNGLIQVTGPGTSVNATELWITREKWSQLVPLLNTMAIPLVSLYFCLGFVYNGDASVAQQGFNIELNTDAASFTIWPQPGGHRVGFNLLDAPNAENVVGLSVDVWTSYGIVIQGGDVYYYDFQDPAPELTVADWTSKTYQQNNKKSYEAMKVFFTVPAGIGPPTQPRNEAPPQDPSWQTLRADAYAYILVYADLSDPSAPGSLSLVGAREVRKSGELLRIPSGFKTEQWAWRILSRVTVSNVQVATTVKELGNV